MKPIYLDFSIDEIRELLQPLGLRLDCTQDKVWMDEIWSIVDKFGTLVEGLDNNPRIPHVLYLHSVEPYYVFHRFLMSKTLQSSSPTSTYIRPIENPYYECKTREEILIKKDLLEVNTPQDT